MSERWDVISEGSGRILEVCYSARKARRAQKRWHELWLWHCGPRTTIRRVAIRDEDA